MSQFIFSLNQDSSEFSWPDRGVTIVCPRGYQQITAGLASRGLLSGYDVEMIIYRIEEIIESDSAIQPVGGEALLAERQFALVRSAFLGDADNLDRPGIEAAFNQFADKISYGHYPVNSQQLDAVVAFIFIRELCHHLNVVSLRFF